MHSVISTTRKKFRIVPVNKNSPGPRIHDITGLAIVSDEAFAEVKLTTYELVTAVYQWTVCLFITALVLSQVFGAVWNSITISHIVEYGRDPLRGPYQVVGTNDVPYADRVITCIRNGKFYEPRLVSSLLAAEGNDAILEDSTGAAKHGYRLVQRRNGSINDELDSSVRTSYREICNLISNTLEEILRSCSALGYSNFTIDTLRVVENATSKRLFRLPNSLPVLIMPFWDNTELARHAVPTWSGDACIFRLEDAFSGKAAANTSKASFRGVNRTIRFERTIDWLKKPSGSWKNGWYEDLDGGRWFSDVTSSNPGAPNYMGYRMFDMRTGFERNCSIQEDCLASLRISRWGTKFSSSSYTRNIDSITILNGSSFGIFHYRALQIQTAHITYDWETLVSNTSIVVVLLRWIMILVALHIGAVRGGLPCYGGGIGCLSGSSSFSFIIISTLPQLKMMLAAFWTVGCRFQGQQAALSNAWFTVYPAIAQLMILYFSLLNVLAKLTRRRMSDVLFGPTVFFFCCIHYYAGALAASGWLTGVDGRVATVVFSDEVKKLHLHDYFISDLAWRMNGKVSILFSTKMVVLGINLVPLLLARPFKVHNRDAKLDLQGIEQALALKVNRVGGLGRSPIYMGISTCANGRKRLIASSQTSVFLNCYELLHLGYVVFGNKYVVACDEWDLLTAMAPLRNYCYLWNHRVCVWTLKELETSETNVRPGLRALKDVQPEMWRLDDKRLVRIAWWQVSSCAIQC